MNAENLLTLEDLRQATARAVKSSGETQSALAKRLGVTPGAISRAVREASGGRSALQIRIVEALTDSRVEELDVRFRLVPGRPAAK